MSSVPKERRGLGRGLEVLLGEAGQPELLHLPVETIHPNPRQPQTPLRARGCRRPGELDPAARRAPADRRAASLRGGFELIAGERRWRAARAAGVATLPARRPRRRGSRLTSPRARRERRPRTALPGRGGARVRVARRRVRALARRRRGARRPLEVGCLEPPSPARAARGSALDARPRRPHAKDTRARCCRSPTTTPDAGWRAGS